MIARGVLLDPAECALVAGVLADGVHRRRARGEAIGVELLAVLEEVEVLARAFRAASAPGNAELPQPDESDVDHDDVTTSEAAAVLGVSDRRVRQLITDDRLSGRKIRGAWFVPTAEVEKYAARRATQSGSAYG